MKYERSAGVVLFRESVEGERLFLLLDYGSHWDYPKGHVEEGEDDLTAARRELMEETGITQADIRTGFAREISYVFRGRKGAGLIEKTVVYFLAATECSEVVLSHEHVDSAWLTHAEARKRLTYANARAILDSANQFLNDPVSDRA